MNGEWSDALAQITTRSLEELCFMIAGSPGEAHAADPVAAVMRVGFEGPQNGHVLVRIRGGVLADIATNMLGDDAASAEQQRDALGEVANIICGHIVPVVGGTDAVFSLQRPTPVEDVVAFDSVPGVAAKAAVEFDNGRVEVILFVDGLN